MRTIRIKLYKFNELSKKAKEQAIEDYRNDNADMQNLDYVFEDAWKTVEKFAAIFDMDIESIDFLENYRSNYSFGLDEKVLELTGQRLATYIWNNYKTDLFKGKYYSLWSKTEITYKHHKEGFPVLKYRHSHILLDNSCVLTGVCYDDDMLKPVYDFLEKPNNRTDFKELLEDCINAICKSVQSAIDYQNTDEVISETMIANEYEFTKDGKRN